MTAEMKRKTGLHCQACGAAADQPCTVDCPEAGLAIAAGTTIEMLAALDLARMPLAVSAALGVLRSALKAAQQSDTKAAPAPDPGAMLTQPPAPTTWEARFVQFGGPSKEKAMEGEIADWRAAEAARRAATPVDLSKLKRYGTGYYMARELVKLADVRALLATNQAVQIPLRRLRSGAATEASALIYPATLTAELEHALGFMNFRIGPMAQVYRAAGHNIATKCEAEQAFVLDRMVRTVITHGDKWLEAFAADIRAAQEAAKERLTAAGPHPTTQDKA
jgi:hypothetical protein